MEKLENKLLIAEQLARNNYWQRLINHVEAVYHNNKIISLYAKERETYQTSKAQHEYGRALWSAPDNYVYFFLKTFFEPMYGSKWAFEPKVLKHELVKPWLLVPSNKI